MRYVLNSISFLILTMLLSAGYLVLGTGQAMAGVAPCSIGIEKEAIPADDTPFNFSISGDIAGELNLRDPGDPSTFIGLGIQDRITITENLPPGWTLESIECVEGDTDCGPPGEFIPCLNITEIENGIIVECLDNDTGSCTFTNVRETGNIPTLSEWGLIAMAVIIGAAGIFIALRRRKAAA